jgi:predicted nucleic acid-binding protein
VINERFLLDTVFIQALLNFRDQYHTKAKTFLPRLRKASEVWVNEAVLVEVCNALSVVNRTAAIQFVEYCYSTPIWRIGGFPLRSYPPYEKTI